MDTFDHHYDVKMREFIFTGYNNNTFIDRQMVMFLMEMKKLTSNDKRILYGT